MSITIPDNIAYLNPNGFYFQIQKYPELNYFLQDVELPGITLGTAIQGSATHDLKIPGETMEFAPLNVTFLIDSKMENYLAIHDWMVGLGYPEGSSMFKKLLASPRNEASYTIASKTVSDCTLTILDGNNLPLKTFVFVDAFPVSLSGIQMTSTNSDITYIQASLTLDYSYYTISTPGVGVIPESGLY